MKHSDRGIGGVRSRLSPLARPFTFGSSSSSIQPRSSNVFSLAASESEPEDSIWGDYAFDLSFLTSDDQRSGGLDDDSLSYLSRDTKATTLLKAEGSELFGQAAYTSESKTNFGFPIKDRITLATTRQDNVESFLGLSNFLESDLRSADSQPQVSPSIPVISTNQLKADTTLEEGCSAHFSSVSVPRDTIAARAANSVSVDNVNSGGGGAAAERQQSYAKEKAACFGEGLVNQRIDENDPCSFFSKMSELHIRCSSSADNDMLDLLGAKATGMSEKSCIPSDQDDSEVDSPCWRGIHSYNTLASGSKALCSRRSSDDLDRVYGLNPLAPHFIPANAKKSLDKHAKECEESSSSSLKKSLSSTFPLSSGDYSLTDIPQKAVIQQTCDRTNGATGASFLTHKADQSFGFASQDSVSNAASILDPSNEFQTSKKLDPSAPLFVPASAKISAAFHEKQRGIDRMIAFETNAHSTAALSSLGNRVLNNVKAERCTAEVGSFGNQYYNGVHEPGTSDSFNAWLGSEVGISENASPDSSEELHGRPGLNPPAHQFALADTRRNVDGFEKKHGTDDSLPVVNRAISSASSVHGDHNVIDTGLVRSKSSVHIEPYSNRNSMIQMECVHPSKLPGSSSLISSVAAQSAKVEDHFASVKQDLSMKGNKDVEHQTHFHISEDPAFSSSKHVKALSDFSQRHGCASSSPSPEMDVKKLLTTMHGLSELLTLVQGHSYGSDSPNEKELALINSIVQNLNLYIRNGVEEHAGNSSSLRRGLFDPKQPANVHELSIRELQPPGAKDMTVKRDLKRKEKCNVVSREMVPDTQLRESGVSKGNGFSQVTPYSGLQQNHPTEEQINPQVLFYRSLWLKAEAERCLIEYEASLSRMKR